MTGPEKGGNPSFRDEVAVAFFLPNLEGGGAERAIVTLANGISELDVNVDLVLQEAVGPYLAEVLPGVRVVNLSSKGKLRTIFRLVTYLARCAPQTMMSSLDLSNMQMIVAAKLARFKGRTVVSQRATVAAVYSPISWIHNWAYKCGIRFTYPFADFVISNSCAAADEIRTMSGVAADKVVTIHNGVDSERISRLSNEPLQDDWFLRGHGPLILSVGSVTARKDMGTLVKAFALMAAKTKVRLSIIGESYEPSEFRKIKRMIADFGLIESVHLPGFDPNPYKWMAAAAVVVSASTAEGCPNVIAEALALDRAIVATDCPGDTAVLLGHGKWGRIVPVGDSERMADAILAALDDPNAPNGRIRAADFSPDHNLGAYLRVLLPGFVAESTGLRQPS